MTDSLMKTVFTIVVGLLVVMVFFSIIVVNLEFSNQTTNIGESFTLLDDGANREYICQITDDGDRLTLECLGIK